MKDSEVILFQVVSFCAGSGGLHPDLFVVCSVIPFLSPTDRQTLAEYPSLNQAVFSIVLPYPEVLPSKVDYMLLQQDSGMILHNSSEKQCKFAGAIDC